LTLAVVASLTIGKKHAHQTVPVENA
jgi:hypothetical protein